MSAKYFFLLHKAYFDKGWAVTNYFKYAIAFFGLASADVGLTLWIAIIYGVSCYFIGVAWFKYGFTDVENEVQNQYNPFTREVRQTLKSPMINRTYGRRKKRS